MDINIKVRIDSPDIMNALLALAEALTQMKLGTAISVKEGQTTEVKGAGVKAESKSEEIVQAGKDEKKEEAPKPITLEEVRSKLSSLSQNGKQAAVKALIKSFGVNKLTDIPKERYLELLKAAEEI